MGIAYHTAYSPDGANVNLFDRIVIGTITAVYPAGTATGSGGTVALVFGEPVSQAYTLIMSPIEDCTSYFTSKTPLGAVMNVNPRLAAGTLTGGSVEVLILA